MVVVIKHKVEMWPTNNPREALGLYELNNCLCLVLAWHWHSLWPSKIPLLSFVLPQCKWCWGWPQTRLGGKRIQVTSLLLLSRFSRVWLCATPQMAAHQAPPTPGFFRQEHWSGLPFPSPMHESEKWKWSCSVSVRLCDPMDCSLPGSSIHRSFQARVLEWVAIVFSEWEMRNSLKLCKNYAFL